MTDATQHKASENVTADSVETQSDVELLVCKTCRASNAADASDDPSQEVEGQRPGATLLAKLDTEALPSGVRVRAVECLSNCNRGCTIALRGPGRWTYVYGNFHPDTAIPIILDGVTKYRDSEDGRVPWRARPQHFRRNCIARIPPFEVSDV